MTSAPVTGSAISISTVAANAWIGVRVDVEGWSKEEISVVDDTGNPNVHPAIDRVDGVTRVTAVYTGKRNTAFFGLVNWGDQRTVHWTIHVPARDALSVESRNGSIAVRHVRGPIVAKTSNGRVSIDDAGPSVKVTTSNGSVSVAVGSLQGSPVRLEVATGNGGVDVTVPPGTSARVDTSTSNGRVSNRLQHTNGPGSISIHTSNGGISIGEG